MVMGEMEMRCELLVLGGGTGAHDGAFRADELGADVIVVEPPGTALTLHLEEFAARTVLEYLYRHREQKHHDFELLQQQLQAVLNLASSLCAERKKKSGILWVEGIATFADANTVRISGAEISRIRFEKVIIATGQKNRYPPAARILSERFNLSWRTALRFASIPDNLCVFGGDGRSFELASLYAQLGGKVTLTTQKSSLEMDAATPLAACPRDCFTENNGRLILAATAEKFVEYEDGVEVAFSGQNGQTSDRYDAIIFADGKAPDTDTLNLDTIGVATTASGHIVTDDCQRTTAAHIFAAGDACAANIAPGKARLQGRLAAETASGKTGGIDAQVFPRMVYSFPPFGWCGLTEGQAAQLGLNPVSATMPWNFSPEAAIIGCPGGSTALLAEKLSGRIIGGGVCGFGAELILAEIGVAIECGAVVEDLALIVPPEASATTTLHGAAGLLLNQL